MHVINATNVNDAYVRAFAMAYLEGTIQNSRAGSVYTLEAPLTVVYEKPWQRVLLDDNRDANPFFHLFEALWLLAGRNDARWLDRFVGDFSSRFAEENGYLHGSYGYRWRKHFDLDGEGNPNLPDQLDTVVRLLKANPEDRRVVIQMWDVVSDLGWNFKDVPCNLMVVPRIREFEGKPVLDITVFNRSNDIVWGLAGANAVQFSVLQEYLAGRIGVNIGRYYQISNNAHLYAAHVGKYQPKTPRIEYPSTRPMGTAWDQCDKDLGAFFKWADAWDHDPVWDDPKSYANDWFVQTAQPLYAAHSCWKRKQYADALSMLNDPAYDIAPDWRLAAINWMERRLNRMRVEEAAGA